MNATTGKTRAKRSPRRMRAPAGDAALPDILQSLGEEHQYQARLLNLLEKQVGLLNQRLQPDFEVMHGVMRYMTQYPDRYHHPKEDLVFEKIVLRDPPSRTKVRELLRSHQTIIAQGTKLLEQIDRHRVGTRGADPHALRKAAHAYIGALRRHMDIEWLHLFPRAQQVLRPEDWTDVDRRMKPILDPVFGIEPDAGFQSLRDAEAVKPETTGPGRLGASLIELGALIESLTALITGASKIRRDLAEQQREQMRMNRDLMARWFGLLPLGERVELLGELCRRNRSVMSDMNTHARDLWSASWHAARWPYEQGEGPYMPKLLRWRRGTRRQAAQPATKGA